MGKEKTKLNPNVVIIGVTVLLVSVLLVFGLLVWGNNNKREIEFQREKLGQEKVIEEKKLQAQKDLEEERKQEEFEKEWQKEIDYNSCIENAHTQYHTQWISYCRINNIPVTKRDDGRETCQVPSNDAVEFENIRQREQEMCVEKYK